MALTLRTCIGCNQVKLKNELLRIVIDQDSKNIVFDPLKNKNGRGAYVCPNINCLKQAINTGRIKKALKVVNNIYSINLDTIYRFIKEDNKKTLDTL